MGGHGVNGSSSNGHSRDRPRNGRPLASVSLDADDLWAYLRTHGDPSWERRPSYLARFFPRVLDLLDEAGMKITFFIVGEDAARDESAAAMQPLVARGHEVGNHSFRHECWIHLYSADQLNEELTRAEQAIEAATGERPRGFRGPGFSWSPTVLETLATLGYRYDATTFPTFIGPLARRYFLASSKLEGEELEQRRHLFGAFSDGFRSLRPFYWKAAGGRNVLEIPVTTVPIAKVPFHMSYLLYIGGRSEALMMAYLRGALASCRALGVEPSFLLHPLDFLGGDEVSELSFFPGMQIDTATKVRLARRVLGVLGEEFECVPMGVHADAIEGRGGVGVREVKKIPSWGAA